MSLSSDQLSVVSLGVSCQVTHQLRQNVELLARELAIADLQVSPSYFDYVGVSVSSLLSMLSRLDFPGCGVPESAEEIAIVGGFPYWPKEEIWLGHYFREHGMLDGKVDIAGRFAKDRDIMRFMTEKFRRLDEQSLNIIFVIGNAQENLLAAVQPLLEGVDAADQFRDWFHFSAERMRKLRDLLVGRLGPRFLGLVVIENDETWSGPWSVDRVLRAHVGAPGWRGEWKGVDENWSPVLVSSLRALVRETVTDETWAKTFGVAGVRQMQETAEAASPG